MATKRGQQDGAKDAAQGVAPVPPQGQTQTPPQTDLGGESRPELTIEALIAANADLSQRLQQANEALALSAAETATALDKIDTLTGNTAELAAKLEAALTRATTAEGREKAALAVIDRLNATNAEQAEGKAVEPAVDLSSTITAADAARFVGVPVDHVLDYRLYEAELVVVTRAGQKIRKAF